MAGDFGDDDTSGGDSYSETSSQSWFSKIMESIKGVLIGLVLFLVAPALLYWNEKRAVDRETALGFAEKNTVEVKADKPDPANADKLVHLSGKAEPVGSVADKEFGVTAQAIKLVRKVEMYQWYEDVKKETKNKLGGGTETVKKYTYEKTWSGKALDSSKYKKSGHENPPMPVHSHAFPAEKVKLGGFELGASLVHKIAGETALPLGSDAVEKLPKDVKEKLGKRPIKADGGGLYVGDDAGKPAVGDLKVSFEVVKPADVSVIARQSGEQLGPYQSPTGAIEELRMGTMSKAEMLKAAGDEAARLTWILRLVGFVVWAVGIYLIFAPLEAVADVIPFLGDLLGAGIAVFAALVAAMLSLVTIAVAWLVVRPLLGGSLLGAAVLLFVGLYMMRRPKG